MALVRLDDTTDWESLSLSTNPRFQAILAESRESAKRDGTFSLDEVRRRLGLPPGSAPRAKRARTR